MSDCTCTCGCCGLTDTREELQRKLAERGALITKAQARRLLLNG